MRKRLIAVAVAGFMLLGLRAALASTCCMENWYTELAGGGSWHRNSSLGDGAKVEEEIGYEINFSIGLKVECWRLALQAHYERYENDNYEAQNGRKVDDKGDLSTVALFLNVFRDIPLYDCLAWYLGAGLGIGSHHLRLQNNIAGYTENSDTEFTWQLMTGFVYDINPCWAVTLNYSWINMLKPSGPTTSTTASKTLNSAPFSNNVDLGIRLKF